MSKNNVAQPGDQEPIKDALSGILNAEQSTEAGGGANESPDASAKRQEEAANAQAELERQNAELQQQLAEEQAKTQRPAPQLPVVKEPEVRLIHPHLGHPVPVKESLVELALSQGFERVEATKAPPVTGF
jgi:hypothetical protein